MKPNDHQIVVTGIGSVTAYGCGTALLLQGALTGRNTIQPIQGFRAQGLPASIASEVDSHSLPQTPDSYQSKASRMAWIAAQEALEQAGCSPEALSAAIGWSAPSAKLLHSKATAEEKVALWERDDTHRESQPGSSAQDLYRELGCSGPLFTDHAACAAGLHAIVHAARLIRSGRVTTCLAGASDSRLHPAGIIGYARLGVLNTQNNANAPQASRPFSKDRTGFIIGEGAGFLMLESLIHAQERNAPILGELAGWAVTSDADNLTDPTLDGSGAVHCIERCLNHADCTPDEIDYLNAHGTSTPNNDHMECSAYRSIWPQDNGPPISSTKSMIGHLGMASGAVESIVTLGALQQGTLPPTLNLKEPDPISAGLNLIGPTPETRPIRTALKTAFGLGGQNAAVIWKKWGT